MFGAHIPESRCAETSHGEIVLLPRPRRHTVNRPHIVLTDVREVRGPQKVSRSPYALATLLLLAWTSGDLAAESRARSPSAHGGENETWLVRVDGGEFVGEIRPLHGVNNGPLNLGETLDLSAYFRELSPPLVRLHDSEWPDPLVVDMHALFPDPRANPDNPESYRFSPTDDYLQAIVDSGSQIVYRLGESIEHRRRKYHVHPPADYDRWAAACLGIIRHYNEGWAGGFRHGIRHWEIWNEPENRPAMWTGSDEDYYRLYSTTARTIKRQFPDLRVGGPSVGATGDVVDGRLRATPFLEGFLEHCRRERDVPLDFFSWHTYTDEPLLYVRKARAIRRWLDEKGFPDTESHLNEWNYLPDNDWTPLSREGQGLRRQKWFERMGGAEGAAFVASVLIRLQDCPVDAANLYSGDSLPFGLFTRDGVPRKSFHAMKAFKLLADTRRRLETDDGEAAGTAACAGFDPASGELTVLAVNFNSPRSFVEIAIDNPPWKTWVKWEAYAVDATRNLELVRRGTADGPGIRLRLPLGAPGILLIRCQSSGSSRESRDG